MVRSSCLMAIFREMRVARQAAWMRRIRVAEAERSSAEGRAFIVAAKPPGPIADGDEVRGAGLRE